jgi:signal peptidase I
VFEFALYKPRKETISLKEENALEGANKVKKKGLVREYIEAILIAVILALFVRTFIIQAFKIPSGSMIPTLLVGDHILVNKFIYGIKLPFTDKTIIPVTDPKRGDVMVFKFPEDPEKDFIKRVIAIEGDVIEIRDKKVYLNNEPMNDKYGIFKDPRIIPGSARPRDNMGPLTVPKNAVFVMGDNRDHSYDSRFWKFVNLSMVKGKAFIIYWSWDSENPGVRWSRLGSLIH